MNVAMADFFLTVLFQMKLPGSVGQKKSKAIEQVLDELGIGLLLYY